MTYLSYLRSLGSGYQQTYRYRNALEKLQKAEEELSLGRQMMRNEYMLGKEGVEVGIKKTETAQIEIDALHRIMEDPVNIPNWRTLPHNLLADEISVRLGEFLNYERRYTHVSGLVWYVHPLEYFCAFFDPHVIFGVVFGDCGWLATFKDKNVSFTRTSTRRDVTYFANSEIDNDFEGAIYRAWLTYLDARFDFLIQLASSREVNWTT